MIPELLCLLFAVPTSFAPSPQGGPPHSRPRLEIRDTGLSTDLQFGFARPGMTVGRHELVFAKEAAMGTDLNQDGDTTDLVLHSVDLVSGAVTNLGLAYDSWRDIAFDPESPDHALALVRESSQGNQDLNGDGDQTDMVAFDLDLANGTVRGSGLANVGLDPVSTGIYLVNGHWAALSVSEASQGAGDLNGDGVIGNALFLWDLSAQGAPVNAMTSVVALQAAHQSYFLFTRTESAGGVDLNGDGDTSDEVLQACHAPTGSITNIGLAGSAIAQGPYSVLTVSELDQGEDLNGDGDHSDGVPHVFSLLTGQITNLQVELHTLVVPTGHGGQRYARAIDMSEQGVAFHVSEAGQGGVDLNGDGDTLDDDILFVHVFATGETRNLGLSVWDFELEGGLLAMQVGKYGGGGGGVLEARIHDLAANTTWSPGVYSDHSGSKTSFAIRGSWVAITAHEAGVDHTGNGIVSDHYLVLADASQHRIVQTGIALTGYVEESTVFNDSGALTVLAREQAMATDLNRDGDTQDSVVQILIPELDLTLNTGASSVSLTPGRLQSYPFVAVEADDGIDHNGDGDTADAVLRVAHFRPR